MLVSVPTWSTCQRACVPAWFMCPRACVPTCQKSVNFSFLRSITCHKSTNVLTWHANFSNGMRRKISEFYHYVKNSTSYLISLLYISYVYVSYIKIVLYFISILHVVLKKSVWILWSSWIVICLSWRSETLSWVHVFENCSS